MSVHAALKPPETGHPRRTTILALMSACTVVTIALVAAINLALPSLAADALRPSSSGLLWIVDAYVIVFACLLIPAGAFGDRFGRKGTLIGGLAVFALGCVLAAVAPTVPVLIAGRALSGAGAALIMPATLSIVVHAFPSDRRGQAIATWTAATGAAGVVGNVGGGLVLQYLSWRGLFWLVAPAAIVLLTLTARLAPRIERHETPLDLPGSGLLIAAFLGLLYGVIEGPEKGWASAEVLAGFAVAAVLTAVFTVYALRAKNPVVDPRYFRDPRLRAGALGVTATFLGLFGVFFVNAQYLQYVKDYSPVVTGIAIGPMAIAMIAVSRRAGAIAARVGQARVIVGGMLTIAVGLSLLSLVDATTPYPLYAVYLVVMAVGLGLCLPALSTAIVAAVPHHRAGLGSGLNSATREVGSALGVAVVGTIMTTTFTSGLPTGVRDQATSVAAALAAGGDKRAVLDAFTDAMASGYRVTAVVLAACALAVGRWLRRG
ncbi:MFS transporter [Phytomonospora endophytica]|uniref:EmrB/QacA subfamily drug resistance transporter n=1 Tax=Phytomonospora endophytica TaxID=714109 RepID=A0A841FP08_9ACTN|nr:MFS transporter [Phytomonospora endophytica]MBB6033680.1 EmrB/QacA subfamily drug resistance transporter [Phytomonospora endophytica]GIG64803.1 MFS transporter [Phytomonospora endophytica]